jgi:putative membrane protein
VQIPLLRTEEAVMPIHRHLLSTLAVTLLLSGPAFAQYPMAGPQRNAAAQRELSQKDMEFMKNAAIGGMAEVELGKLAQQNGHSPDVKSFGARMVQDHSRANDQLTNIAKERGVQLPQQLDTEHMAMRDRLAKLQGDAFDRAYIKMMVADHDKDMKEFRRQAQTSPDRELKRFARETLAVVEQHDQLAHNIDRSMVAVGSSRGPR